MRNTALILAFILFNSFLAYSQDIFTINQEGTHTINSVKFYDSGGLHFNYGDNEDYVITFCSEFANANIYVNFADFETEEHRDFLYIYDGPDINSPLIAEASGQSLAGQQIISSPDLSLLVRSKNFRYNFHHFK